MTAREVARLHALMRPGETFAGVVVTVIGGHRSYRMVLVRDGERRVVTGEDERDEVGAA